MWRSLARIGWLISSVRHAFLTAAATASRRSHSSPPFCRLAEYAQRKYLAQFSITVLSLFSESPCFGPGAAAGVGVCPHDLAKTSQFF
jgi:hypothetical protein